MNAPATCPECGKPLPEGSSHDLCPACLMGQVMASQTLNTVAGSESAAPPPTPEEIAGKFPQFEVVECLGRGGMGVVYKARQKSLDRWVAIKVLAPERIHEERFAENFEREAKTLAKMSHPNIVTVFDHGQTDGLFYIVMEFVDGLNLRDLLREAKMEPEQALAIIPPICDALEYAHDKGVVHRDIKPENILLDRDGRVKIADFGIASLVGASGEKSGTPPYMAPEQENGIVDRRADIYALGAVLYEMLTGERPNKEIVAPSKKVQIDIRLDEIVLRALEKTPELRYQTAGEFRTVLQTMSESPPSPLPSPADELATRACESLYATPEYLATTWGSMKPHEGMATLALYSDRLVVGRGWQTTTIPLHAVRKLGVVKYPRCLSPKGLHSILIDYEEAGKLQRILLTPRRGGSFFSLGIGLFSSVTETNQCVYEWFWAIREAITTIKSQPPDGSTTPELYRDFSSEGLLWAKLTLVMSGVLVLPVSVFLILTTARLLRHPGPELIYLPCFVIGIAITFLIARSQRKQWRRDNPLPPTVGKSRDPAAKMAESETRTRFSRTAIVGAVWSPMILFAYILWFATDVSLPAGMEPPGPGPAGWVQLLSFILLVLGITAPFGTTLLGWIAVSQIRRSAGKLHGLWLAVFDGLLFPLLALDALLIGLPFFALKLGAWPQMGSSSEKAFALLTVTAIAVATVLDTVIIRRVWRAVNAGGAGCLPASAPDEIRAPAKNGTRNVRVLTAAAIAVMILAAGIGVILPMVFQADAERRSAQFFKDTQAQHGAHLVMQTNLNALSQAVHSINEFALSDQMPGPDQMTTLTSAKETVRRVWEVHDPLGPESTEFRRYLVNGLGQWSRSVENPEKVYRSLPDSIRNALHSVKHSKSDYLTPDGDVSEQLQRWVKAIESGESDFGPVVEQVLAFKEDNLTDCLDIDANQVRPHDAGDSPEDLDPPASLTIRLDAPHEKPGVIASYGTVLQLLPNEDWDSITAASAALSIRDSVPPRGATTSIFPDAAVPSTYIFKAKSGKIGLLQITGLTKNPRGVKIRYKLVQGGRFIRKPGGYQLGEGSIVLTPSSDGKVTLAVTMVEGASRDTNTVPDFCKKDGWFVYIETPKRVWIFDGIRQLDLLTPGGRAAASPNIRAVCPKVVLDALPESVRKLYPEQKVAVQNASADTGEPFSFGTAHELTLPMNEDGLTHIFDFGEGQNATYDKGTEYTIDSLVRMRVPGFAIRYDKQAGRLIFYGISGAGIELVRRPDLLGDQWEKITDREALELLQQNVMSLGGSVSMETRDVLPQTCFFKTGTNLFGVLQVTGFTENPRGVKIRYKLVRNFATQEDASTKPSAFNPIPAEAARLLAELKGLTFSPAFAGKDITSPEVTKEFQAELAKRTAEVAKRTAAIEQLLSGTAAEPLVKQQKELLRQLAEHSETNPADVNAIRQQLQSQGKQLEAMIEAAAERMPEKHDVPNPGTGGEQPAASSAAKKLQFRWVAAQGDAESPADLFPDPNDPLGKQTLRVLRGVVLGHTDIEHAEVTKPAGRPAGPQSNFEETGPPVLRVTFSEAGAEKLAAATKTMTGRQLAILWMDHVISAPRIMAPMTGRSMEITGHFTNAQISELRDALNPIHIQIAADGALTVEGEPCPASQLAERLGKFENKDAVSVVVQANEQVPHQQVQAILDTCKAAGINGVRLAKP